MKEYRIPRYTEYIKLFAYDSITKEVFLTYRLKGEEEFHTDKIQRVDEDRLSEMLVTLRNYSQKDSFDTERLENLTRGLPRIKAPYALTSVEGCIDDADEKEKNASRKKLPVFPKRADRRKAVSDGTVDVIQPMIEIPMNFRMPHKDSAVLPMYLWDCVFRVIMNEKPVSLPMFVLADSVNDLELTLRRYIDGGKFPTKLKIGSFTLVSARIVASTTFNEAFPLCLDSRVEIPSKESIC